MRASALLLRMRKDAMFPSAAGFFADFVGVGLELELELGSTLDCGEDLELFSHKLL